MNRIIAVIFFAFLLVILQLSLFPALFFGSSPEVLLIAVIFFAVNFGIKSIWKSIIFWGLALDIFLFFPAGVSVASFFLIATLASFFAKKFLIFRGTFKFLLLAMLIIAGTILNDLFVFLIMKIFLNLGEAKYIFPAFGHATIKSIVYNLAAFAVFYFPLKRAGAYFFGDTNRSKI